MKGKERNAAQKAALYGMLIALAGKLSKEGKAPASTGCAHCPLAASCSKIQEKEAAE